VMAGRSLREVEEQEGELLNQIAAGWVSTLILSYLLLFIWDKKLKSHE